MNINSQGEIKNVVEEFKKQEKVNIVLLEDVRDISTYIDGAIYSTDDVLLVVGWIYDPKKLVKGFASGKIKYEDQINSKIIPLDNDVNNIQCLYVDRLDVSEAMGEISEYHRHGFILVIPNYSRENEILIDFGDNTYAKLPLSMKTDNNEVESFLNTCFTNELYEALYISLGDIHYLTSMVGRMMLRGVESFRQSAYCDKILLLESKWILINGWIGTLHNEIASIVVREINHTTEIKESLNRYPRPDLNLIFPKASAEAMGYIAAVKAYSLNLESVEIEVFWKNGNKELITQSVESITWAGLNDYLNEHPRLYPLFINALDKASLTDKPDYLFRNKIRNYNKQTFSSFIKNYPTMVDNPDRVIVAIDKAYSLGSEGILVYGWKLSPRNSPSDVTVHNEFGKNISIKDRFIFQLREDVATGYRERFPNIPSRCGFIVHIPMATDIGDARAICFHYPEHGDIWIRLPLDKQNSDGIDLLKEMLAMIPHPNQLNHHLFNMLDNGLGLALESINQKRLLSSPTINLPLESRQFGTPAMAPTTSIIVPLYGRCDFMRYQLARFSDDHEIQNSDLIYVVDDPTIVDETLSLAARYQWLFNVPFRVIWYGKNLGFAGANNVGARFARAERLLLLNSDVFPQNKNWLSSLEIALDNLPNAGAVGPLLQFGDGSIQHAGMHARVEPQLPGFLINTHPGMGQYWDIETRSEQSFEQPMLTAACLLLRTQHFKECDGFDEGYVIGDFEDSDLCLNLRTMGLRLYIVPKARLWHLERQSQILGNVAGVRQLITLFNGWRYLKKIEKGTLINPLSITLSLEVEI